MRILPLMRGYDSTSYGAAFADVYDDWYRDVSDVPATVRLVAELAGDGGRVLELGVGTGRLAVPLAAAGLAVTGLDASEAMLDRLRRADPAGAVRTVRGDMADDLPAGPWDVVLVAYNTLFNLVGDGEQARCLSAVGRRLAPGGRLVVEAFVPDEPFRDGSEVGVRSLEADRVVLAVTEFDGARQAAQGQFVELTESSGVRLRPWRIRYSTVGQLDVMAVAGGLELESRWRDVTRAEFDEHSDRHVSVYRRPPLDGDA